MTESGTLLGGRYQLDSVIGRGGMAEVWRARDTRLDRDVAVKRLRVDLASDPTFQARFRREAQSAAGLNHPNIVSVYDTGEELDTKSDVQVPYIVMELVNGHTLRDVLRDGRKILPERALEFTMQVLDALAYSHRNGIIHRDIKPANVMLTPQGNVKVMDFGIARAVADTSATMTQTAAVIGTAQYLSPEQARGETVDHRSDVYSCGCLLYELLVGRPPFVGDSPVSVAYQHVREVPVPPSQLDPEITTAMDAITLKSLAKDPADRYDDAKAMRDDIARLLAGEQVTAVIPAPVIPVEDAAPTQVLPAGTTPASLPTPVPPPDPALLDTQGGVWQTGTRQAVAEEEPKRNKLAIWLVALTLAVLAALGWGAYEVLKPKPPAPVAMTTVPMVKGLDLNNAQQSLASANLKVGKVTEVNGDEKDKGKVIKQTPDAQQSVPVGTEVDLTINVGQKTAKVPEKLVGKTEQQVTEILTSAGFKVKRQDAAPGTEPEGFKKGQVTEVNPSSGAEIPVGNEVTITVATGKIKVPEGLEGKSEKDAKKALGDAGFTTVEREERVTNDTNLKDGQVMAVDPAAGTWINPEDPVKLIVAKVEAKAPTDLVGKNVEDAKKQLEAQGWSAKVVDADPASEPATAAKGDVLKAEQTGDKEMTLTVATGKSVVPNLVSYSVERATNEAKRYGFNVEVVEEENAAKPGTVFAQSPEAGNVEDRGKAIQIKVAKAPATQPTQPTESPTEQPS